MVEASSKDATLRDAPSLIETIWPAQKISAEAENERLAVAGQTLTGLGGYWKGRKPLILNRACILGALLPATDDPQADLEVFELLMQIDDDAFGYRIPRIPAAKAARLALQHTEISLQSAGNWFVREDQGQDWAEAIESGRVQWRGGLPAADARQFRARVLAHVPYLERVSEAERPEQLGQTLPEEIWPKVNAHLGTTASTLQDLVQQLGQMRFGRRPKVGDAFSGSGQIPYEALRIGCDTYASDPNPIAALLTWSSFELAGADEARNAALQEELKTIVRQVEAEMAPYERNSRGDQAKAYLYCLEVKCPQTGWVVPLVPGLVISPKTKTIGKLRPDHSTKRIEIDIISNASAEEVAKASAGTTANRHLVYEIDGQTYRTSIASIRGDARGDDGRTSALRRWDKTDVAPRDGDIYGERLYCIQWATAATLNNGRQDTYFSSPTSDDLRREREVREMVTSSLSEWQRAGLAPDMQIEPGQKTDEPIRTRGWTQWHHLFHPRQLLMLTQLHRRIRASTSAGHLYYFMPRAIDNNSRLNRWASSQGGGLGGPKGTFDNQALNTLDNFAVRGALGLRSLVGGPARSVNLTAPRKIVTCPAASVSDELDIWVTDPPYADAVVYHELTEFFISWLRRNPPAPFDTWVWDSRRPIAIQGEGLGFRQGMVAAYKAMADHMPENGLQIVMFTHQSGAVWADMAQIFWGAGLQVRAAWYISTETNSNAPGKRGAGLVQGTVILVLRKRTGDEAGYSDEIAQEVRTEVARQIETLVGLNQDLKGHGRIENLFEDADLQMAGYAAALRVLTRYSKIDGQDMATEALRAHDRGGENFVERIIAFAVQSASEHMVPEGLERRYWEDMTGSERFYLKMLDLEASGVRKLENYQNFSKAFRVPNHAILMGNTTANAAQVKRPSEFKGGGFEIPDFGATRTRAILYAIYQIQSEEDGDAVLSGLRDLVDDYMNKRAHLINVAEYIARKRDKNSPEEARAARILAELLRNDRLM